MVNALGPLGITDFKFIGTVESQTNNFFLNQFILILHEIFTRPLDSLVYMPNYPGKIKLEPNSWFKYVFGLMTPPEQGVSTNIGQNFAETLQF